MENTMVAVVVICDSKFISILKESSRKLPLGINMMIKGRRHHPKQMTDANITRHDPLICNVKFLTSYSQ